MSLSQDGWKNKKGTTDRTPPVGYSSWLDYWAFFCGNYSGDYQCAVSDCLNDAEVGAHVINDYASGEWIAPLCRKCNKRVDEFELDSGLCIISANKGNPTTEEIE